MEKAQILPSGSCLLFLFHPALSGGDTNSACFLLFVVKKNQKNAVSRKSYYVAGKGLEDWCAQISDEEKTEKAREALAELSGSEDKTAALFNVVGDEKYVIISGLLISGNTIPRLDEEKTKNAIMTILQEAFGSTCDRDLFIKQVIPALDAPEE